MGDIASESERSDDMEKNYTTGSVYKNVLLFSLPYLLSYFLQTLYGMADLFIIANRRGLNDAAAVGIVEKIISFLFLVPSSMLSTVSALGAQNFGAGKSVPCRPCGLPS